MKWFELSYRYSRKEGDTRGMGFRKLNVKRFYDKDSLKGFVKRNSLKARGAWMICYEVKQKRIPMGEYL